MSKKEPEISIFEQDILETKLYAKFPMSCSYLSIYKRNALSTSVPAVKG